MFFSGAFPLLIFIAMGSVGGSPISRSIGKPTMSLTRQLFNQPGSLSIVERDRIRLQALHAGDLGADSPLQVDVSNGVFLYTAEVGVGTPPRNYTLAVDTGSSNIWVGANKAYIRTNTSQDTGKSFHVQYDSGNVTGEEWTDTVTLGPDLVVRRQCIGVAKAPQGFAPLDGAIGFGPVGLTKKTVGGGTELVPTVMDNLFSEGAIPEKVLGVYFLPSPVTKKTSKLTFGGYDESVIVGPVNYVPLTHHKNASLSWGVDQTISYGPDVIMRSHSGVIDSAVTRTYIPYHAFEKYINKTGATYDNVTQFYSITHEQYDNLEPLVFHIGGIPYKLTPNAQIWPRSLNAAINGTSDAIYLVVSHTEGLPVDLILGNIFLERFYSVYDTTNRRVGFAETQYTYSDIN